MAALETENDRAALAVPSNNAKIWEKPLFKQIAEMNAEKCLADLFLTDPCDDRAKHIHFHSEVISSACAWILKTESYQSWNDPTQRRSHMLWLSGRPGLGKTMLAIFLTQELERSLSVSNDAILLYYFCDGRDEKRNTAVSVLRGLIFQLLQQQPSLAKHLLRDYRLLGDGLFKDKSFQVLWKNFEKMVREINTQRVYCIIDALDECKHGSLEYLLNNIRILFGNISAKMLPNECPTSDARNPGSEMQKLLPDLKNDAGQSSAGPPIVDFRMMVFSREDDVCIAKEFDGLPRLQLDLDAFGFQSGLRTYIDVEAEKFCKINDTDPNTATLSRALRAKGDGTFLWVSLALGELNRSPSGRFLHTLNCLSTKVEEIYHQALLSIPDNSKYLAAALLRWLTMAVRPLQLQELEVGLGLSTGASINQATLLQIIDSCGSLVIICGSAVALKHQTTRDFLLLPNSSLRQDLRLRQFHVNEEATHSEIAQACLTYFDRGSLARGPLQVVANQTSSISKSDETHLAQFPFLHYAIMNWTEHARCSITDGMNFVSPFFQLESVARTTWLKTYWISSSARTAPNPVTFSLLHLAAYFGILPLAISLENQGFLNDQIAARDDYGNRAIFYAVENNHFELVSFLLSRGATKIGSNWLKNMEPLEEPLLHCAAKSGNAKTVSLLLDCGERVSEAFDDKWNLETNGAYITTLARYRPEIAREITKKWYDGERKNYQLNYGQDETALHVAASCGHDTVVMKLLEVGANINAQTTGGWTALHNAAWFGNVSTLRILLAQGANIMVECDHKWTPLHYAAHQGQTESIRLLLEYGAQIDAKSSKQKSALHVASSEGNLEVVRLLLEHNADIESRTIAEATPLHVAVWAGQDSVVKLLLDHGADKAAFNRSGQTPAMVASKGGHSKIEIMLQAPIVPDFTTQVGKDVSLETSLPLSSSPQKAIPNPSDSGATKLSRKYARSSLYLPELHVADTQLNSQSDPEANPLKQFITSSGYDDGLIPMSPSDHQLSATISPVKLSDSLDGLILSESSLPAESPSSRPPPEQTLLTESPPLTSSPTIFASPHSHSVSSTHQPSTAYPPPPPYPEHHQSRSPQNRNAQYNPYFPTFSTDTSALPNQAVSPLLSQATSPDTSSPAIVTLPPLPHPWSHANSPHTSLPAPNADQSPSYSPLSYPLPPSQNTLRSNTGSLDSYNSTPKYQRTPPPLPPRSPISRTISNGSTIDNVIQYQQPIAQAQVAYASPTIPTNPSYTQIPNQTSDYMQSVSSPQSNTPSHYTTTSTIHPQTSNFVQTPMYSQNHSYSQPQPQSIGPSFSFPPPAPPHVAQSPAPSPPFIPMPPPYMNTATHTSGPSSYLNASFGSLPAFGSRQPFAPPPNNSNGSQSLSFGAQALRKSGSFLNLNNILGRKFP